MTLRCSLVLATPNGKHSLMHVPTPLLASSVRVLRELMLTRKHPVVGFIMVGPRWGQCKPYYLGTSAPDLVLTQMAKHQWQALHSFRSEMISAAALPVS